MSHSLFTFRIRFVSVGLILFAVLLIGKLYLIQVVHGETYNAQAQEQYVQPTYNLFDRGSIFFTGKDGEKIPAAALGSGFIVAINPEKLADPQSTYEKLSKIVVIDEKEFFRKALKVNDPYEIVAKRVSREKATHIDELDIVGLDTYLQKWRHYPGERSASHVLGLVAYKGNELAGRYGLERQYEETLHREGSDEDVNFFAEVFSNVKTTLMDSEKKRGNVVTTIEPAVEAYLEKQLEQVAGQYKPQSMGGIVMDPKTGAIRAMAARPDFNPNDFQGVSDTVFSNPLVQDVYEMGSIVKALTMAAGLDAGVVSPSTTYDDKGVVTVNGSDIYNYDFQGRGVVDMQTVLNQSLNTGAVFVQQHLGNKQFADYMRSFGVGTKTGIDLPNEASGLVDNLRSPRDVEYATASFGQGIAMTPIATTRALSVLANGGTLVTPYVGKTIRYKDGTEKDITPAQNKKRVIKKETSEEISRMLVNVTDQALGGGDIEFEHYSVAVKTGTAQMSKGDGGGYYDDRYLHSFFGYFPAYDPEYIVFLYAVDPKGVRYASQTWTTPFMETAEFLINYYDVPPDR